MASGRAPRKLSAALERLPIRRPAADGVASHTPPESQTGWATSQFDTNIVGAEQTHFSRLDVRQPAVVVTRRPVALRGWFALSSVVSFRPRGRTVRFAFQGFTHSASRLLPCSGMDVPTLATVANLLSVARRLTRAQAGTVYCREVDGLRFLVAQNDQLAGSLGHAAAADLLTRARLPWTERSIATYVALALTTVNIPDAYHIPMTKPYTFNPRVDVMTGFRTRSMLVMPLHAPIRGVIQLINATNDQGQVVAFSWEAETIVEDLASDAATAFARH